MNERRSRERRIHREPPEPPPRRRSLRRDRSQQPSPMPGEGRRTKRSRDDGYRRRRREGGCDSEPRRSSEDSHGRHSHVRHRGRDGRRKEDRRRKQRSDSSPSSSVSHRNDRQPPQRSGVVSVDCENPSGGTRSQRSSRNKKRAANRSDSSHDDETDHYRGDPGAMIGDNYQVVREIGMGTFGRVVECFDLRRRNYVATKVVRAVKRYYESALIEARIVQDINRRGGRGLSHCVRLLDSFTYHNHYCIVLEILGPSLFDFLKQHDYRPFPMICVQDFTVQLLETLEFLHSFRLIHTDLKIENILLTNAHETVYNNQRVPASTKIKLIDFGSASYDHDKKSKLINTRQYRAPEVILGTGWSMPSDMWSLGCILVELYKGELLFATHDSCEHLALVDHIIGCFPLRLTNYALSTSKESIVPRVFDHAGRIRRLESILPPDSVSHVRKSETLSSIVRNPADAWFLNLLRQMLMIDPAERLTAHESLHYLARQQRDVVRCI